MGSAMSFAERENLNGRVDDQRLPAATYLLSFGQALNLTAAVLSVTVAALVGIKLAPSPAWATVPYGMQFAAVMLCTYPCALLMRRCGRRVGFSVGALMLLIAGIVGYVSVTERSFSGLILAHAFLGGYIACANFYRFAATEGIPPQQSATAISLVVSGGVFAAIVGPLLATALRDVSGQAEFSLCYAALCGLAALTFITLALWTPPILPVDDAAHAFQLSTDNRPSSKKRLVAIGIIAAAIGYFVMNLLMVQSSLVMKEICSFSASSLAIQAHVFAMFIPSFFSGRLIAKIGARQVLAVGFVLLAMSAGAALVQPLSYAAVVVGLLFLGLGWNFTYVGGGALLACNVRNADRHSWQGINDTVIATCATLGAFLPSPLLALLGWSGSNLASLLLCLAAVGMCGLGLSRAKVTEA